MTTDWRREIRSATRRLEAAIPHWPRVRSVVIHAKLRHEMTDMRVGPLTLDGENLLLERKEETRRFNVLSLKAAGTKDLAWREPFMRSLVELSSALLDVSHRAAGNTWQQSRKVIKGELQNGAISWLLALHHYAGAKGEGVEVTDLSCGQPCEWNENSSMATLIEDTATASACFADWLVEQPNISACPIELHGLENPPCVRGKKSSKVLTELQYAAVDELVKAYPNGLTVDQLIKAIGNDNIRHVLRRLVGKEKKRSTIWTSVIVPAGKRQALGWRIKST